MATTEPKTALNIDDEHVPVVKPAAVNQSNRPQLLCEYCNINKPQVIRPKTGDKVCKDCFCFAFEEEVHYTITSNALFKPGMRIVLGASGGKDSTVLAHVMTTLNQRHNYGLDLVLLSIDEGIQGYRDDSLETVKRNQDQYSLPLKIISYAELYNGWTMDKIVRAIGNKNNCTFCGVFRRQALDRGAQMLGADMLLTGHNCDDLAETVLLNILRGDLQRAGRCVSIITGKGSQLPRAKPLKYSYEKEIVMYAFLLKLDYFATECKYAPFAFRGYAREYIKEIERVRPRCIVDMVVSAETFQLPPEQSTVAKKCVTCGYLCAQRQCKACQFLEALENGTAKDVQRQKKSNQDNIQPKDLTPNAACGKTEQSECADKKISTECCGKEDGCGEKTKASELQVGTCTTGGCGFDSDEEDDGEDYGACGNH